MVAAKKPTSTNPEILAEKVPGTSIFVIILLCLSLFFNVLSLYFLTGNSFNSTGTVVDTLGIKKAILEVEYEKVGGKKTYDLINRATQMQMKDQLPQIEQYVNSNGATTPSAGNPTQTPSAAKGTLTPDEIVTLSADAAFEGNPAADILVIEYSDMECPFCIKQFHDTKLFTQLKSDFPDTVAVAFKNNKGVNHAGTEAKALGALCAQKLGGNEAYITFYTTVMDGSTNEGGVYPVSKLSEAAQASGVDTTKWQACVDSKETLASFTAQTGEAQKYGLGGTPGTLIINKKTGKYDTVEGAYPYSTFTEKINALLKE